MSKFDIRQFLTENKLTETSKRLNEQNWSDEVDKAYEMLRLGNNYFTLHNKSGMAGSNFYVTTKEAQQNNPELKKGGTPPIEVHGLRFIMVGSASMITSNKEGISVIVYENEEGDSGYARNRERIEYAIVDSAEKAAEVVEEFARVYLR